MVAFEAIEVLYARDLGTEPEKATADRIELAFPLHLAHDLPDFQVRVYVPAGDLTAFVECTLAPVPERAAQEPRTDIKGIA